MANTGITLEQFNNELLELMVLSLGYLKKDAEDKVQCNRFFITQLYEYHYTVGAALKYLLKEDLI